MVQQCWNYKFDDASGPSCSGPFEKCAILVDCKPEEHTYTACFALARLDDHNGTSLNGDTSNTNNKTVILSGGCLPPSMDKNAEDCDTKCLGTQKRNGKYYCCCTSDGCNNLLIPKFTPLLTPTNANEHNITMPPFYKRDVQPPNTSSNYTLPVMLLALMAVLTTIIMVTFFRRTRLKRNGSELSSSNHRNSDSNDNATTENQDHRNELQDMRSAPDVLVPFRNSFADDNNHHLPYGQIESHHKDINNASRTNHISPMNGVNNNNNNNSSNNNDNNIVPHEQIDLKRVKLLNIVGSGRFGTVHKATLYEQEPNAPTLATVAEASEEEAPSEDANETVSQDPQETTALRQNKLKTSEIAVKIIPSNELQSWQNELRIYSSPRTRHANILTFLGFTESPDTNSHWLLVEYASNGSLHHFLKENTVTWPEFLSISLGIVRGLSHLHDADIAHRDFKSKNVLLRHNLSPCITDFGVASILDVGSGGSQHEQRKKYLQVGTPRYMAPEVLECSVAFTKISFTKIDVYALSLVLWELLSRCYPLPKSHVNDYDDTMMSVTYARAHDSRQSMMTPYYHQVPQLTSTPPRSPRSDRQLDRHDKQSYRHSQSQLGPNSEEDIDEASVGLLEQVHSSPKAEPGACRGMTDSAAGGVPDISVQSTNGLDTSIDLSDIVAPISRQPMVPVYKMPFEDVVGPNPDINTMRQVVVGEKLRPPIKPEWRFYPLSKLCQAIVDGWEYDHDARISASCFVERIEALQQQQRFEEPVAPPATYELNSSQQLQPSKSPQVVLQEQQPDPAPTPAPAQTKSPTAVIMT